MDLINAHNTGQVIYSADVTSMRELLLLAVKEGKSLRNALIASEDLSGADLSFIDLSGAYLSDVNFTECDLSNANLSHITLTSCCFDRAKLYSADMRRARLSSTTFLDAGLHSALLTHAFVTSVDMSGAALRGVDMSYAKIRGSSFVGADLSYVSMVHARVDDTNMRTTNMTGCDLRDVSALGVQFAGIGAEASIARCRAVGEGDVIGWKLCERTTGGCDVVVKLLIPKEAKRSSAFGRKCRAEYADVLEVFGDEVGVSIHDGATEYKVGTQVWADQFDEDWSRECTGGIHFFMTRAEAEAYA